MSPFGVKVLCIEPGFFKTSITDSNIIESHLEKLWNKLPQEVKDEYGSDFLDRCEFKSNNRFHTVMVFQRGEAHFQPTS